MMGFTPTFGPAVALSMLAVGDYFKLDGEGTAKLYAVAQPENGITYDTNNVLCVQVNGPMKVGAGFVPDGLVCPVTGWAFAP